MTPFPLSIPCPGAIRTLLVQTCGPAQADELLETVAIAEPILACRAATGPVVAQSLALALFADLLERVPEAKAYVAEQRPRRIVFDHGALRTVAASCGNLPGGRAAFARLLEPLGYRRSAVYPLERLGMTGHSFTHEAFPEDLPQYFVSELHPERFSPSFQAATDRVIGASRDPLSPAGARHLADLARDGALPPDDAAILVKQLIGCFGRQHEAPSETDYAILLAESAEMAWIATEGNAFNHATDRVNDVDAVAEAQRHLGRPIKDSIEVSASGRIRQTAFRAAPVERPFRRADGSTVQRTVPGSFFEFISRGSIEDETDGRRKLDLGFDSANAQGIFRMTAAGGGATA